MYRDNKVGLTIPAYNEERLIGPTLDAVPEIIDVVYVVNDCSTDRTPYALELFHEAIHTITNEQNEGLPASINKGIMAAKAQFIVRVDADDYVNANFLNFLYYFLDQNPDIDAVACDYWLFNETEEWLERIDSSLRPIGCAILFRKQQLLDIGMYDETFKCHEEKDLKIRFEKKYAITRLELPLYRYRRHENNITNNAEAMEHYRQGLIHKHGTDYV